MQPEPTLEEKEALENLTKFLEENNINITPSNPVFALNKDGGLQMVAQSIIVSVKDKENPKVSLES